MNSILSKLQHNYYEIFKVILFVSAAAIIAWVSPKESIFKYEFQVGKPWNHNDLFAPFDFSIIKTEKQIEEEKALLLGGFQPYFTVNKEITESGLQQLKVNFDLAWELMNQNPSDDDSSKTITFLTGLYNKIQNKGVIRYDPVIENKEPSYRIKIINNNEVKEASLGDFFDIRSAIDYALLSIRELKSPDSSIMQMVISQSLLQNIFYAESKSNLEQKELLKGILPNQGLVQKGELIISTGELVTPEKYQELISLKNDYEKDLASSDAWMYVISGVAVLISMLFLVQLLFMRYVKTAFYVELKYVVLVLFTQLLFVLFSDFIFEYYSDWSYMIPFALLPILISAFLDAGAATVIYLITLILVSFYAPTSF